MNHGLAVIALFGQAMELVRSALVGDVHDAAAGMTVLGGQSRRDPVIP